MNGREVQWMSLQNFIFLVFLGVCTWQDIRKRSISLFTFLAAAAVGMGLRFCQLAGAGDGQEACWEMLLLAGGMLPGGILLGLSALTGEGIGKGDGWFFLVSGIYLGLWKNLILLWGSLMLCFPVSLFLLLRGKGKTYRIPFLPFTVPIGLGVIFL